MRPMTWALSGLILVVLLPGNGVSATPTESAGEGSSQNVATPVAAEELAINADEVASGVGVRPAVDASNAPVLPIDREFQQKLRELFEDEAVAIELLREQIADAVNLGSRLELERRLSDRKQQTEIGLLELHLERARSMGRTEDVLRIEAGLEELLNPPPIVPTTEKRTRASH